MTIWWYYMTIWYDGTIWRYDMTILYDDTIWRYNIHPGAICNFIIYFNYIYLKILFYGNATHINVVNSTSIRRPTVAFLRHDTILSRIAILLLNAQYPSIDCPVYGNLISFCVIVMVWRTSSSRTTRPAFSPEWRNAFTTSAIMNSKCKILSLMSYRSRMDMP